jgi:hypothetical protein
LSGAISYARGDVQVERLPVAGFCGDAGNGDARGDVRGILFGDERVAAERLAHVAALEHRRGIEPARRQVQAVQLENVPKFDDGAVDVARGDQLDGAVVVGLGPFLG